MLRPGCYTLAHDENPENLREALDVTLSLLNIPEKQKWDPDVGGTTHYARYGEKDELLSIIPKANTLTMVFRSKPESNEDGTLIYKRNY